MKNLLLVTLLSVTACYGRARVRATYAVSEPDLVYVSPGVYVLADYDEPVFYADHVYWRYAGGVWYRSSSYAGGWRVSTSVPVAVRTIDRPYAYVHYRANGRATIRRDHRATPPAQARDHRRRWR